MVPQCNGHYRMTIGFTNGIRSIEGTINAYSQYELLH